MIDRTLTAAELGSDDVVRLELRVDQRTEILTSIPGVSRVTAAGLLTQMPELGRLDAKAVASLAGLAPVTRQSGAWQGRSFIQGGRARRLLYMPALAAICYNLDLRVKYHQLVAQGKPRKVARWSPSCASSSCWPTCYSNRIAAGCLSGAASRSSLHDRCLRGSRAWLSMATENRTFVATENCTLLERTSRAERTFSR